jgi:bacillithiol synthase
MHEVIISSGRDKSRPYQLEGRVFKLNRMRALPFAQLPTTNSLFLDFTERFQRVADYYPSREAIPDYQIPHRKELCEILQRQNNSFGNSATKTLISKLRRQETRCLITGQQVGLLTGPLYTLWKALTMIHLSQKFEKDGAACVPVFWMATEDHNLNEIASFGLLKQNHELLSFSLREHLFLKRQPAGTVKTDDPEIKKIFLRAFQEIKIAEIKNFYSGTTLATGFAKTLLWLLKDFPILIVNPSDPALKQLGSPFFKKVFQHGDELLGLLNQQNSRLKQQNYPVQVQMEEGRLPLFRIKEEERIPLSRSTRDEIPPEELSPSALLRPLFQDYLFPTLAYIGGPAEIAYFAQLHPWYKAMGMSQPPLFARVSLTLIPPATRAFLETKRLSPEELYLKEDTLVDALLDHEGMKRTRQEIRELQTIIQNHLAEIGKDAIKIDPTLEKGIETAARKIQYQLNKIDRKTFLAAKRKNVLLADQIRKAKNVVYPDEKLQERFLNIFSFAPKLPELLHQVYDQIQWDVNAHQWIYL